ncbi:MAG: SCO family protein [Bacillales bacterium]
MLAGFLFLVTGCSQGISGAKNWPVEDFTFINQDGEPFGLTDLKGKVWVANFIFTNCETVCLPMTANMVQLQNLLKEENITGVELVSFSVDPEVDTPDALKKFGEHFSADFDNYNFLTGYDQEFIEEFARENFKELVDKPENDDQVIHGTRFYLMDQEGRIVKYYSGLSDIPFEEIIDDIKKLQNQK